MSSLFRKFARTAAIVLLGIGFCGTASAGPITGNIFIAGLWTEDQDILNLTPLPFNTSFVLFATEDFSSVGPGAMANIDNIDISDRANIDASMWTIGAFTFVTGDVEFYANGSFFDFVIEGVMSAVGFDDTIMRFGLSTNGGINGLGSYSIARVPEPGAIALIALGLGGLVLMRRRRTA